MLEPYASSRSSPPAEVPPRNSAGAGIYVHFPFCIRKCDYCDFYSLPLDGARAVSREFLARYRAALKLELRGRARAFAGKTFDTVYFGGGTSSLMPPEYVASLLEFFRDELPFAPPSAALEITLEGNPENFSPEYLTGLAAAGVTRVNAGIQTFRRSSLEGVNRHYDPERYARILDDLASAPIADVGADLIYGLPDQSEADFFEDLERVLRTRLNHLSLYSLTVEAGTAYGRRVEGGEPGPDE